MWPCARSLLFMLFDAHLTAYPVPDSIHLVSALSAAAGSAARQRYQAAAERYGRNGSPSRPSLRATVSWAAISWSLAGQAARQSTAGRPGRGHLAARKADRAHVLVRLGGQQPGLRRLRPWPIPRRAAGRADHQEPAGFPPAGPPVDRLPGPEIGRQRRPLQVTGIAPRAGHAPPQAARTAGWRVPESSIPALTGPSRLKSKGSPGAGSRGGAGEEGLRQAWSGKRG
jgi:hypothetical protein